MSITAFFKKRNVPAIVLCIAVFTSVFSGCNPQSSVSESSEPQIAASLSSAESTASEISSVSPESSNLSETQNSSAASAPKSVTKPKAVKKAAAAPAVNKTQQTNTYSYASEYDIDNNLFFDALVYTGYNIAEHRKDGKMWEYVLAKYKRGMGWLSNIGYGGGCSGYETINGKPDIKAFEKGGLVCASYATYVYFNYLPCVVGIDTSSLPRPARSISANDWYTALKQWISRKYSRRISFTAKRTPSKFISFKASESIPIGSLLIFCDDKKHSDYGSHIAIYAGYKNNYNWVFHVGNSNGPEFCAVERMLFGPDPQWPIAVITPPSNIRLSAMLEINLKDETGAPLKDVSFSLKNSGGKIKALGKTDANGKLIKEGLIHGDYVLTETVPVGYTADAANRNIKLTPKNNSRNLVVITNRKIPVPTPSTPQTDTSSADFSQSSSDVSTAPLESSDSENPSENSFVSE